MPPGCSLCRLFCWVKEFCGEQLKWLSDRHCKDFTPDFLGQLQTDIPVQREHPQQLYHRVKWQTICCCEQVLVQLQLQGLHTYLCVQSQRYLYHNPVQTKYTYRKPLRESLVVLKTTQLSTEGRKNNLETLRQLKAKTFGSSKTARESESGAIF